jgi:hypothetical protein
LGSAAKIGGVFAETYARRRPIGAAGLLSTAFHELPSAVRSGAPDGTKFLAGELIVRNEEVLDLRHQIRT